MDQRHGYNEGGGTNQHLGTDTVKSNNDESNFQFHLHPGLKHLTEPVLNNDFPQNILFNNEGLYRAASFANNVINNSYPSDGLEPSLLPQQLGQMEESTVSTGHANICSNFQGFLSESGELYDNSGRYFMSSEITEAAKSGQESEKLREDALANLRTENLVGKESLELILSRSYNSPCTSSSNPITVGSSNLVVDNTIQYGNSSRSTEKKTTQDEEAGTSSSSANVNSRIFKRKCIVCLRDQINTETIFDDEKNMLYYVDVLTSHLNFDLKINYDTMANENSGLCLDCKNNLQHWHLFKSAIKQKHESLELISSMDSLKGMSLEGKSNVKLKQLSGHDRKAYLTKCKICKKGIFQWNLKSHAATHENKNNRPWKCDSCIATFKTKGALASHRNVVHLNLKNHICTICGSAFKSASVLYGHMKRHKGQKDHKCVVCQKEFYTYSALKGHQISHQTACNFVCEICGKGFKKKKAVDEHRTLHTGEKPHQCPICGREVRVKSNLYKHMKIHKKAGLLSAKNTNLEDRTQVQDGENSNMTDNSMIISAFDKDDSSAASSSSCKKIDQPRLTTNSVFKSS